MCERIYVPKIDPSNPRQVQGAVAGIQVGEKFTSRSLNLWLNPNNQRFSLTRMNCLEKADARKDPKGTLVKKFDPRTSPKHIPDICEKCPFYLAVKNKDARGHGCVILEEHLKKLGEKVNQDLLAKYHFKEFR